MLVCEGLLLFFKIQCSLLLSGFFQLSQCLLKIELLSFVSVSSAFCLCWYQGGRKVHYYNLHPPPSWTQLPFFWFFSLRFFFKNFPFFVLTVFQSRALLLICQNISPFEDNFSSILKFKKEELFEMAAMPCLCRGVWFSQKLSYHRNAHYLTIILPFPAMLSLLV